MKLSSRFARATLLYLISFAVWGQSPEGAWTFERAVDYEGLSTSLPPPPASEIAIANGALTLPGNCMIQLQQRDYYAGGPFQALLKAGDDEGIIGGFLAKQFSYRLAGVKHYYGTDPGLACNTLGRDFLVSDDRLIVVRAGALFYSFTRSKSPQASPVSAPAGTDVQGIKVSRLPFKVSDYIAQCAGRLPTVKGVPQPTAQCAPLYMPHVASRNSKDKLSQLVGSHAYQKGGARNESEDYNNPVANNLHPVFLVFPPLKDVVLVRVDDLERANERDPIRGAYLAIKSGQVTDQLNQACSFDVRYVCSDEAGVSRYQLNESGKFIKLQ